MVPTFAASLAGIPAVAEGIKRWTRSTSVPARPLSPTGPRRRASDFRTVSSSHPRRPAVVAGAEPASAPVTLMPAASVGATSGPSRPSARRPGPTDCPPLSVVAVHHEPGRQRQFADRLRQRRQRVPLSVAPAHVALAVAGQPVVHILGHPRVPAHVLEPVPPRVVRHLAPVRDPEAPEPPHRTLRVRRAQVPERAR